jgi:hypothetical protein
MAKKAGARPVRRKRVDGNGGRQHAQDVLGAAGRVRKAVALQRRAQPQRPRRRFQAVRCETRRGEGAGSNARCFKRH